MLSLFSYNGACVYSGQFKVFIPPLGRAFKNGLKHCWLSNRKGIEHVKISCSSNAKCLLVGGHTSGAPENEPAKQRQKGPRQRELNGIKQFYSFFSLLVYRIPLLINLS